MKSIKKFKKGITLIEVVIAAGLFAFFLGSVIAAVLADAHNGPVNERRLRAANLAREGVEVASQIRDTAWTKDIKWDDLEGATNVSCFGLTGRNPELSRKLEYYPGNATPGCAYPHWRIVQDDNGEDISAPGDYTFNRKISIINYTVFPDYYDDNPPAPPFGNSKLVTVTVSWKEGEQTMDVTMKKLITDWKAI